MNTFFKYVQPTIVKTSDIENLRKDMRNMYLVNFNVFGIEYFSDHYIICEDDGNIFYYDKDWHIWEEYPETDTTTDSYEPNYTSDGYLSLEDTDEDGDPNTLDVFHFELESSNMHRVIDIPRLYIKITDKFMNDYSNIFQNFICKAVENQELYATGIEGFRPGEDYYINKTLYDYLYTNDIIRPETYTLMPDYLRQSGGGSDVKSVEITEYWVDRTGDEDENYTDLQYYYNKNLITLNQEHSDDELENFYSTFTGEILGLTTITDELRAEQMNQIYDLVLNYWNNFGSDCASTALSLLLNNLYATTSGNNTTCNTNCGSSANLYSSFNADNTGTQYQTRNCFSLYSDAMKEYLKKMLGDAQFYKDWFYSSLNDEKSIINEGLLDELESLLNDFLAKGYNLSTGNTGYSGCKCPDITTLSSSDCNNEVIKNYLKVLNWVRNYKIDENINKIKILGGKFGELLPSLQI